MPIGEPNGIQLQSLIRRLMAAAQGTPDDPNPPVRYAENRRTRTPTIFAPEVDPDGSVMADPQRVHRPDEMMRPGSGSNDPLSLLLGSGLPGAESPVGPMGPRFAVAGLQDSEANPASALHDARRQATEGPGTIDAYDQMEELLARRANPGPRSPARGVMQIKAPGGAERANPYTIRHEEGHAASNPFFQEARQEFGRRFGTNTPGTAEALGYRYESGANPEARNPMELNQIVDPGLEGLLGNSTLDPRARQGIRRYQQGMRRPVPSTGILR